MNATVYKSTGNWYIVKVSDGLEPSGHQKTYNARLLGKFKMDGLTSTNPIAVGDLVNIEMENELEGSVTITEIGKRKNYITRSSPANKHQHHIIASNLDQSLLFATLKDPKTSQGFIDRFLITSEAYHIPSIIVFNKSDLYRKKEAASKRSSRCRSPTASTRRRLAWCSVRPRAHAVCMARWPRPVNGA